MKKVVSLIILISALLLAAQPCYAEFDVTRMLESGMSLTDIACAMEENVPLMADSLSQLNTNEIAVIELILKRELQRRNFSENGVVVPMGEYIVGVDIPSGAYSITLAEIDSIPMSIVTIFSESGDVDGHYYLMEENDIVGKVTLKDGQTVKISSDSVTFAPYIGLGF